MTLPSSLEKLKGTVGIWTVTHESLPPQRSGEIAHELEELGYAAMWIPEAYSREAFTSSHFLLQATSKIAVATGIANIWARDAVTAASAARSLNAAFNDRFVLGLGVSHEPIVQKLRKHDYVSPLAHMKSFLEGLNEAPMFAIEGSQEFARVIAALGPKMLELGKTLAHGVHPYLVTPEHTAIARQAVGDQFIGVEQAVVLGQSREEFLKRAHEYLDMYTGLPNYRNNWLRLGFSEEDFVRGGSERLCDALVVHGDEQKILDNINEHRSAGADHICLQVLGNDLITPPLEDWRAIAKAVN
jgi:probable F420-dependent oxidoreductase